MYRLPPMYSRAMTEPSPSQRTTPQSGPPALAIGAVLVLIGLVLFAAQLLDFQLSEIGWPFFIILAGIGILLFGLFVGGESGIVIGGTITTTVGLVLLFQDTPAAGKAGPTHGRSSVRRRAVSAWRYGACALATATMCAMAPGGCSAASPSS